ncbi:Re/Si-specific NAD(P)(+) transhydrogenase subunit alpha [Ferrimicrobium sp.]|uniref:Re/Si-specific NAD(P)(+) transhydrogenase subunit alpha n=1 Tax=Ferrimicrobium sp. TaxID=2926050 RepID=UPI002639C93B|nr:Re/Si-specific NAD(P)(+) transhydrogenase subunit alpha [Ferrimicrobium sp.]
MKIVTPKESADGETRVACVPDTAAKMTTAGLEVWMQADAGTGANLGDSQYAEAGAQISPEIVDLYRGADVVLRVQPPTASEVAVLPSGVVLISMLQVARNAELLRSLAAAGVTAFAMELLPRISRAQSMDVLSSQASIAGYKAALMGADYLDKILPMQMTAAGTMAPARFFVLGAGVAGLQAIATARRLGAVVEAFDVRSAVREEVQSLGAKFVNVEVADAEGSGGYAKEQSDEQLERQRSLLAERVAAADVVVTTASIPGRSAPILITTDMVRAMRPGSVIVDVAADSGGNCECTVPGEVAKFEGVTIVGVKDLARTVPYHASLTYARNLSNLVLSLVHENELAIDLDDEIVNAICVTHKGELRHGK